MTPRGALWRVAALAAVLGLAVVTSGRAGPSEAACHGTMQLAYGDGRIVVVDADGTHSRQLTHPPAGYGDGYPSWSPDGKRIAFERDHIDSNSFAVDGSVYTMGADSSDLRLWAPGGLDPLWSPSGKQILFVTTTGHDNFWNVIGADRKTRPAVLTWETRDASWSPDGRHIVIGMWHGGLDVVNADGTDPRNVTHESADWVAWSPDGRRIAFSDEDASGISTGLVVVGADGRGRRLVVHGRATAPAWSPDATRLAYVGSNGVGVVNADGSGRKWVPISFSFANTPAWSPDGAWIAFMVTDSYTSSFSVYLMKPDGTGMHKLQKITRNNAIGGRVNWRPCTT